KGIHPGFILERELKQRKIKKSRFAISLQEFPQTLGSITKGKRSMNTPLALKIEQALGIEEGYFMTLQVYYEIKEEKKKLNNKHPDISKLRHILFWDTNMDKIDWEKQKAAVINRVFERGNEEEKNEITRFYGKNTIKELLKNHAY
ncbi:MAG TPA: plasmid maintenance system antidote protein, partial [Bacteroidia bacterium]|nr:plasmid maintenance system antidote protein [Bacteroidia bacterium]